jgi:hypothetical protein
MKPLGKTGYSGTGRKKITLKVNQWEMVGPGCRGDKISGDEHEKECV